MCHMRTDEVDCLECPQCGEYTLVFEPDHTGEIPHCCGEPPAYCGQCQKYWETQFDHWGYTPDGDDITSFYLTGEEAEVPIQDQSTTDKMLTYLIESGPVDKYRLYEKFKSDDWYGSRYSWTEGWKNLEPLIRGGDAIWAGSSGKVDANREKYPKPEPPVAAHKTAFEIGTYGLMSALSRLPDDNYKLQVCRQEVDYESWGPAFPREISHTVKSITFDNGVVKLHV